MTNLIRPYFCVSVNDWALVICAGEIFPLFLWAGLIFSHTNNWEAVEKKHTSCPPGGHAYNDVMLGEKDEFEDQGWNYI